MNTRRLAANANATHTLDAAPCSGGQHKVNVTERAAKLADAQLDRLDRQIARNEEALRESFYDLLSDKQKADLGKCPVPMVTMVAMMMAFCDREVSSRNKTIAARARKVQRLRDGHAAKMYTLYDQRCELLASMTPPATTVPTRTLERRFKMRVSDVFQSVRYGVNQYEFEVFDEAVGREMCFATGATDIRMARARREEILECMFGDRSVSRAQSA